MRQAKVADWKRRKKAQEFGEGIQYTIYNNIRSTFIHNEYVHTRWTRTELQDANR